jgi:hypothetical protein
LEEEHVVLCVQMERREELKKARVLGMEVYEGNHERGAAWGGRGE